MSIIKESICHFKFNFLPALVDYLIKLSTYHVERKLKQASVTSLLIDNTVLFHGVTHETAWIATGEKTGYSARIPVHSKNDHSREHKSTKYLPSIISLAKRNKIELCLSDELLDEQVHQPMGRFKGYSLFDYSLFQDVDMRVIRDVDYTIITAPSYFGVPNIQEQRKTRLESKSDCLYLSLLKVLGEKNSQDIWHIVTAERNKCYCFLTMDFKLIKNLRAQKNNEIVKSLTTKVLTPEEFGKEFNMLPVPLRCYSYHHASYPVRNELNWHDSKRQKWNKNI